MTKNVENKIYEFLDKYSHKEYNTPLSPDLDSGLIMFYDVGIGKYFSINHRKIYRYFPFPKQELLIIIKEWGIKAGYRFIIIH